MSQEQFFIQVASQYDHFKSVEWFVIRDYETAEELDDIDYKSQEDAEKAVFNLVRKSNRRQLPHMPSMSRNLREFHDFAVDHLASFNAIPCEFAYMPNENDEDLDHEVVWNAAQCWEMAINLGIIPVSGLEK
ncbi:hypothetical protein LMH73_008735 [Vibrio splendidus]|nr:hypothetical protein [Vibrio splendidus]MCC4879447.1 hypothetical protein [Vibrio splendidus]